MNHADALALLSAAIPSATGGTWADVGAGGGTFTRALASLVGPTGRVYAVDADPRAVATLGRLPSDPASAPVVAMHGDVAAPLGLSPLDGIVLANVLHFVADGADALALIAGQLRPGGRLVLIEYENRAPSRWVPYPVAFKRFQALAAEAGLSSPALVATRPSAYGGDLYVASATRVAES
ncbi:MAG TPA: class I SAM-dependent methyltransferase [Longimicrobiaceae bacterium]|nr:class I SAM-dependent methyltransferase [Longimicrobiaceae bacterium]